ncbi:MAG: hypothetical protein K2Z81_17345, partial [Cyanobacteria bacterium]|nr:hypothetical protein [Cyanobacteriota bacterium]
DTEVVNEKEAQPVVEQTTSSLSTGAGDLRFFPDGPASAIVPGKVDAYKSQLWGQPMPKWDFKDVGSIQVSILDITKLKKKVFQDRAFLIKATEDYFEEIQMAPLSAGILKSAPIKFLGQNAVAFEITPAKSSNIQDYMERGVVFIHGTKLFILECSGTNSWHNSSTVPTFLGSFKITSTDPRGQAQKDPVVPFQWPATQLADRGAFAKGQGARLFTESVPAIPNVPPYLHKVFLLEKSKDDLPDSATFLTRSTASQVLTFYDQGLRKLGWKWKRSPLSKSGHYVYTKATPQGKPLMVLLGIERDGPTMSTVYVAFLSGYRFVEVK